MLQQRPEDKGAAESAPAMQELIDELEALRQREKRLLCYVREKTNHLLQIIGTLPLAPEELDDDTLLTLDPIGIVGNSFAQVLDYLNRTNDELTKAWDELQAIFDSAGAAIVVVDEKMLLRAYNRKSRELFFSEGEVIGCDFREVVCDQDASSREPVTIFDRVLAESRMVEQIDFCYRDRHFHVVGTPVKDKNGRITRVILVYTEITERKRIEEALRRSEARYRDLFENANDLIQSVGSDGSLLYVNRAWREVMGYEQREITGMYFMDIVHPDCLEHCRDIFNRLLKGESVDRLEATFITKTGDPIVVEGSINCHFQGGELAATRGIFRNITSRKQAEEALKENERRFRLLYEQAPLAYQSLDHRGRYLEVNQALLDMLGFSRCELIGRWMGDFMQPESRNRLLEVFPSFMKNGRVQNTEFTLLKKDGTPVVVAVNGRVALDGKGDFQQTHCILHNITERKEAEERIRQLAYYDSLTGLPNRVLLRDRLCQALEQAKRQSHTVGVLFIDLDRFKGINDTLGHGFGDELLTIAARRLRECTRKSDTVSRLGGDEFVVVLPFLADRESISTVAGKILESLARPFQLGGHEIFCTGSVGIASFPADGEDVDALLKNADTAMYQAKEQGRNTYEFYAADMNAEALDRLLLMGDLRRGLERDEFFLHYQPQMCMKTGRMIGMEALIRWNHPELGLLPPRKFISLAEESGGILPLGSWVLKTACKQNHRWQQQGYPRLKMAVNISGRQFKQGGLVELVQETLNETGHDPALLELELTESILMDNGDLTCQTLQTLKRMGIQIAIDDFGTGYSSLSYLKHFPIDRLKIDASFVHDITSGEEDAAIAEAIIALAHSLKLKVVAEGVQTREQLEFLRSRKCDEMQGHYFSRAASAGDLRLLLEKEGSGGNVCLFQGNAGESS